MTMIKLRLLQLLAVDNFLNVYSVYKITFEIISEGL